MISIRNSLKQRAVCTIFIVLLLAACTLSPTTIASQTSELVEETDTFVPSATLPTIQTEMPTLMATPDLWKVQKCQKVQSVTDDHVLIWNYAGDIEGHEQIDMLLNFTKDNEILGFVFDFDQVREYRVNGCVEERAFTMWLQQGDIVEAIIQGEFPETDPRGFYSSVLSFDVITGSLMKRGNSENFAVYLRLVSGNGGTMENRFKLEGVEDDAIILNASQRFLSAVASDDRVQVVDMIRFPVQVWFSGEERKLQTAVSFLASYNDIFGGGFKERLAITFPNYLIAYSGNFGGIGLSVYGGGSIIFDGHGKVIAINNSEKPALTPAITP